MNGSPMTCPIERSRTILVVVLSQAFLLSACGTHRLQSFERFSKEMTQATYHSDRKACANHLDIGDYRECIKRTDEVYKQLRKDREKAEMNP